MQIPPKASECVPILAPQTARLSSPHLGITSYILRLLILSLPVGLFFSHSAQLLVVVILVDVVKIVLVECLLLKNAVNLRVVWARVDRLQLAKMDIVFRSLLN